VRKPDDNLAQIIAKADRFVASLFVGRGVYLKQTATSLELARKLGDGMALHNGDGMRKAMIYAVCGDRQFFIPPTFTARHGKASPGSARQRMPCHGVAEQSTALHGMHERKETMTRINKDALPKLPKRKLFAPADKRSTADAKFTQQDRIDDPVTGQTKESVMQTQTATLSKPRAKKNYAPTKAQIKKLKEAAKPAKSKPAKKAKPRVARDKNTPAPGSKREAIVKAAMRPNGATADELKIASGWKSAPWKRVFDHPERGLCVAYGLKLHTIKNEGEPVRYKLTK
jgi:hypothetical protein